MDVSTEQTARVSFAWRMVDHLLNLYRRTLKRIHPLHQGLHWLAQHFALPVLERLRRFRTMPDDPFWFRAELLLNLHERPTRQQLRSHLRPGMVVLDVGAHVGYYARLAAPLVGRTGRVLAFEPHPRTYATLHANLQSFGQVQALQMGLSDAPGTAQLYDYLMMSASGSIHYDPQMADLVKQQVNGSDIAPRIRADFPVQAYDIALQQGDAVLAEHGITTVDVIKMDIEGAELLALRGLRATIANSPGLILIMEYNPQALSAFGHEPQAALAEVRQMGFDHMFIIRETDGSLETLDVNDAAFAELTDTLMARMGVVNLLFRRDASAS
ncbi:MAG: FkbM family methyltransferase [Anaerolineales bacterium]